MLESILGNREVEDWSNWENKGGHTLLQMSRERGSSKTCKAILQKLGYQYSSGNLDNISLEFVMVSGEEIATICIEPSWTGKTVTEKLTPYMPEGATVTQLLTSDMKVLDSLQTVAEMDLANGDCLTVLACQLPSWEPMQMLLSENVEERQLGANRLAKLGPGAVPAT